MKDLITIASLYYSVHTSLGFQFYFYKLADTKSKRFASFQKRVNRNSLEIYKYMLVESWFKFLSVYVYNHGVIL